MNPIINDYILIILILLSMYFDLTQKRIPNFITFPAILSGLIICSIFNGLEGFKFSGIGFLVGLGVFLIPFILGGMGGGDVKLMAAIGALKGWEFVVYATIYAGLAGGIIVILFLIYKKKFWITLKKTFGMIIRPILFILNITFENERLKKANDYFLNLETVREKHYIPYGVAIGLGTLLVYYMR